MRGLVADDEGTPAEAPRSQVVLTAGSVVRRAARLCGSHPLRAYDAVQLASALTTAEQRGDALLMVAFDHLLRIADVREGLTLDP